jgi:hypothetical protein
MTSELWIAAADERADARLGSKQPASAKFGLAVIGRT